MTVTRNFDDWAVQIQAINQAFAEREHELVSNLEVTRRELGVAGERLAALLLIEQQLRDAEERERALSSENSVLRNSLEAVSATSAAHEAKGQQFGDQMRLRQEQLEVQRLELESASTEVARLARELDGMRRGSAEELSVLKQGHTVAQKALLARLDIENQHVRSLRAELRSTQQSLELAESARREAETTLLERERESRERLERLYELYEASMRAHDDAMHRWERQISAVHDQLAAATASRTREATSLLDQFRAFHAEHERVVAQHSHDIESMRTAAREASCTAEATLTALQQEIHALRSHWIWRWTRPPRLAAVRAEQLAIHATAHPPFTAIPAPITAPVRAPSPISTAASTGDSPPGASEMNVVSAPPEDYPQEIRHVYQLLSLHGREFLESSYALVLGRPADVDGLHTYLYEMAQGASKTQILALLALSPEGRVRQQRLPGLQTLVEREQRTTLGLWPRLLRRIFRGLTLDLERQVRAVEYRLIEVNGTLAAAVMHGGLGVAVGGSAGSATRNVTEGQAHQRSAERQALARDIDVANAQLGPVAQSVFSKLTGQ
jgi:hypothetical protein